MIDWTGHPPFGRETGLKHTLELLHERRAGRAPLIVEIGTSESYNPDGLGNALLAFAWYTLMYGGKVKSVDTRAGAVHNSKLILEKYVQPVCEVEFYLADAYEWAPTVHEPIDLLYVDAGYELSDDPDYAAFVKRHPEIPSFYVELFNQFEVECFRPGALMLFDDTDPVTFNGKGHALIPYLLGRPGQHWPPPLRWKQVELRGVPVFPMVLLEKV